MLSHCPLLFTTVSGCRNVLGSSLHAWVLERRVRVRVCEWICRGSKRNAPKRFAAWNTPKFAGRFVSSPKEDRHEGVRKIHFVNSDMYQCQYEQTGVRHSGFCSPLVVCQCARLNICYSSVYVKFSLFFAAENPQPY